MFSISLADGLLLLEVESDHSFIRLFYGFLLLDALQVLLLVLRDLLLCGTDIVAKPSPDTHATRRRSDDHQDAIDANWHRDRRDHVTLKFNEDAESAPSPRRDARSS